MPRSWPMAADAAARAGGARSALQLALLEALRAARIASTLWLKVDTGMNRLGFRPGASSPPPGAPAGARVPPRALRLHDAPRPAPTSAAHAVDGRAAARASPRLRDRPRRARRSIANSAANSVPGAAAPSHADWVRPGLALYGVSPLRRQARGAISACGRSMTLESTVIAVRAGAARRAVGYGGDWRAARDSRVAILAGGYGDGTAAQPAERRAGADRWPARAARRPRLDGHDRGGRDRSAAGAGRRPRRALGRGRCRWSEVAAARRHDSLRTAVRRQSAGVRQIELT